MLGSVTTSVWIGWSMKADVYTSMTEKNLNLKKLGQEMSISVKRNLRHSVTERDDEYPNEEESPSFGN